MKEWKEVKLGDVISLKYGKDHKALYDGCYPVYGSGGVMRHVNNFIYDKPSILIPRKGSLNNIIFIDKPFWTVDTMFWSIIDTKMVLPLFLYYELSKYNFAGLNVGTAVPSLTVPIIEEIKIELPSLSTQRRIARILGALDDKIELNRRMNDNLEQQARALFKSWFVDFEPFRSGDFVNSELGMIPKGWKVGKLGDIAEIVMGQSPAGHSYNESGDGCIFYQGRTEFGTRYPKIRLFTSEPKRLANIGDILLSVRAPVGDINVATVKCCIGRGLASLHSKDGNDSLLLYSMLNLKSKLEMFNDEGTVFGCVTKNDLYNMPIVIPEKNVIQDFEVISSSLDNYIKYNFDQSQVLSSLRDTLLLKLVSGELPVDRIEKGI